MNASPSPEVTPALDESRPTIGPNMADDPDFCREVLDYCYRQHVYPQVLQQQTLWPVWKRIDDAFRVKGDASDLDIAFTDAQNMQKSPDGKGQGGLRDRNDGYSSRVFPATLHKQLVTKVDLHMSIAWNDGLPIRAQLSRFTYEHPLYQPNQESCDALNRELENCSREINLKKLDRLGRGSFAKVGHAWVLVDWEYELEDLPMPFALPQDRNQAMMLLATESQRFGQPPQIQQTPYGPVAQWTQRNVKKARTTFKPLRYDDVFVDQTQSAYPLENQLCPCVRSRTNRLSLFGNDYDPQMNPFGYLNCQQAMLDSNPHWQFNGSSDTVFQRELQTKWGLNTTGQIPPANALKQRWDMWPKMAVYQDPKTGKNRVAPPEGIECPKCDGRGRITFQPPPPPPAIGVHPVTGEPVGMVPQEPPPPVEQMCPLCDGRMVYFPEPHRYVVTAYGNMEYWHSSATCLRIQRNPTVKDKVPLLYTCNLSEDTAGAIPLSKAEASMKAVDQEATSYNQWFDFKNRAINPPWLIPEDAPDIDYNTQGLNIRNYGGPNAFQPLRPQLDYTANLIPFMQAQQADIRAINGMSEQLLGMVNSGRRSATELQNAFDAGKMPIIIEVDQYGEDILGGWANFHKDNCEAFMDRDLMLKRTGFVYFGDVQIFTQVADEFLKRQAAIGNLQYVAQMVGMRPDANISPVFGALCRLMKLPINPEEVLPDGGIKKAISDGNQLVAKILGTGQFIPPTSSDPDQIFIAIFEEAMKDEHWLEKTPETIPVLGQRLQAQMQMQQMKLQQQLMMQQHQMMTLASQGGGQPGEQSSPPNQPPMSNTPPATVGGQNQQLMG